MSPPAPPRAPVGPEVRPGLSAAFDKYELVRRLAVEGMAEIFLARSASLGGVTRECVIKRILPEYSSDGQFVSMFIDEARIFIGLEHPNIVRPYDFGQVDGTYFMAMEYVDGVDLVEVLREHKRRQRKVAVDAAAFVVREMAAGLHHAHMQRDHRGQPLHIVHRDVSFHNVWACGVVLHELLVGARLFASESPLVTISRVCEQAIPRPSEERPDVPKELDEIVMRALERDLDRRYATAEALARHLFGEMAALKGLPRTARVRAMG